VLLLASLAGPATATSQVGGGFPEEPSHVCVNERPFRVTPRDVDWVPAGVVSIAILGRLKMLPVRGGFRYEVADDLYSVKIEPVRSIAQTFEIEALEMLKGRVEVVGCLDAVGPGGAIPVFSATAIPDEDEAPEPRPASIESLLERPDSLDGAVVRVEGMFGGAGHRSLPPHTRATSADWVLEDREGAVWVGGEDPAGDGFRLDPEDGADLGTGLAVVGRVSYWKGKPRVRAERVVLLPWAREAERPVVLFTAPASGRAVSPGSQLEVRFSRAMAPESVPGQIRLAYEGDATATLPGLSVRYDEEWWTLLVTLPPDLEQDRWLELSLGEGLRDAEGRRLKPVSYRFRVDSAASPPGEGSAAVTVPNP